jgi:hypothetical protein
MGEQGAKLNQMIEWAAQRNRWYYVGGITEAFERHGYCADDESFYVQFVDSILGQGDFNGVIHPNGDGHRASRDLTLDAYSSEKPDWRAYWGIRVVLEAVRITDTLEPPKDFVPFTARINDSWYDLPDTRAQIDVPVDQWYELPDEQFRYRANLANDQSFRIYGSAVFNGLSLVRAPTDCTGPGCGTSDVASDSLYVDRTFSLDNGWGRDFDDCVVESGTVATQITRVCTDSTVGPDRGIELRYRITVINLSNADPVAPGSDNWQMCGWSCASGPGSLNPPLAAYIEVAYQHGYDIYDLAELLAAMEERIGSPDMWSSTPPAMQPEALTRVWSRTDKPVADEVFLRTWMWGPQANGGEMAEAYAEASNGFRIVQYFDKARMEVTHPDTGDPESVWYVTNGLLVVELITGRLQRGDATFEERTPAQVNVAGDADDPLGPTYATFGHLLDATPAPVGSLVTQRLERAGVVINDPALATQEISVGMVDTVTNHSIAAPFWSFMNASGTIYEDGAFVTDLLFQDPFFATGRPITEAYWANVKVGGVYTDVLIQCFERRCLTYTPSNDPVWRVEAGNVGQPYYRWRYD